MSRWKSWADRAIESLQGSRRDLRSQINKLSEQKLDVVTCERCGCLVLRSNAVVGKAVAKETGSTWGYPPNAKFNLVTGNFDIILPPKEYKLHTPYYCKLHAPKAKKEKK